MKCRNFALDLINVLKKENVIFSGKDPKGIAAGCLYLSILNFNIRRTQKQVSLTAEITEVTLRKRFREYKKYINLV